MSNSKKIRMSKPYILYGIVFLLVAASWVGNYAYYHYSQLPHAGFLTHYIEETDTPSVVFELLYVANNNDKRKIQQIRVEEQPDLKFYPVQVHQQLRHQTIYKLMGYYDASQPNKAATTPLKITSVTAYFNEGPPEALNIGELIIYRDQYPQVTDSPVNFTSGGSSSDNKGSTAVVTNRPVTLTGTTSEWLSKLGTAFHFSVNISGSRPIPEEEVSSYPVDLKSGQSVLINYQFNIPSSSSQANEVYNVLLTQHYQEADGKKHSYYIFANYLPYFTESQMREYVRAQRRAAP